MATDQNALPFSRAEFDRIYSRIPRLNVEVILRTADGVVLTKRSIEPCKGQWHIPGGTVRFAESLPAAVRRVARDELGVEVSVGQLLGYIEYPQMVAAGYRGWPVGFAFAAELVGGRLHAADQAEEIGCFSRVPPNTITEQASFLEQQIFSAR
jgi:ADP-ribose pyrophosphatase YjhB (NUDIX family)